MHPYGLALLWIVSSFLIYKIAITIVRIRHHGAEAKRLGCQPAPVRPQKFPFGIDGVLRALQADREKRFTNMLEDVYHELGRPGTWLQNQAGSIGYVTVDPKNIQALLATQFNDFELGSIRRGALWPMFGNGIFTADGKGWEHARAMMRPQFVRDQISDLDLEELHVQNLMRHLVAGSDGWTKPTDLQVLFFRLTLDSATEFLFGQSVESQVDALPGTSKTIKTGHDWTTFGPSFDNGTAHCSTRFRFADMYWIYDTKEFRQCCKRVHDFADYYVNLALSKDMEDLKEKELEKGDRTKQKYIFLEALARQTRDPIELRSQLLNILLAGRDTTAGLLGWLFYLLTRHPTIFEKLRETIINEFGTFDSPHDISFSSLKSCSYLQHCLNETLRIYPMVPSNSRRAVKDTTLPRGGGPDGQSKVYVKKGQEITYTVYVMQRRKDIWGPDAEEFKPERWVGLKPGWEYLPFNGGPRICLGQQFALTEASYVVVRMLQRYDRIENLDSETTVRNAVTLTSATNGVKVRLHEASA